MQEHLTQFAVFCEKNPFDFSQIQLDKIKQDIINPRNGVVCDEYVDFELWMKGLRSRQEYFAEYIEKVLEIGKIAKEEKSLKLLEVGCGRNARLSKLLAAKGYEMTAMDPKLIPKEELAEGETVDGISYIEGEFCWEKTDITEYDAIVAQEPCEATEHIIRACVAARKNFVISLCGTAHQLINGEMPKDVYQWYDYLKEIGGESCFLINPQIVPGYVCTIMLGIFV